MVSGLARCACVVGVCAATVRCDRHGLPGQHASPPASSQATRGPIDASLAWEAAPDLNGQADSQSACATILHLPGSAALLVIDRETGLNPMQLKACGCERSASPLPVGLSCCPKRSGNGLPSCPSARPTPMLYREVRNREDCDSPPAPPHSVVYVGDTPEDQALGLSCGCTVEGGGGRYVTCPPGRRWPRPLLTQCPTDSPQIDPCPGGLYGDWEASPRDMALDSASFEACSHEFTTYVHGHASGLGPFDCGGRTVTLQGYGGDSVALHDVSIGGDTLRATIGGAPLMMHRIHAE
jgi:hypothetical protein